MADPRGERAAAVTLRPALPDDREHCAAIAVAAWTPIYAHRRDTLGESLFDRLHPRRTTGACRREPGLRGLAPSVPPRQPLDSTAGARP